MSWFERRAFVKSFGGGKLRKGQPVVEFPPLKRVVGGVLR